jgi:hypothetical protein
MKIHKLITLDYDIAEKLKLEDNQSQLINALLREHFDRTNLALMNKEQLETELKKELIKRHAQKEIEALNGHS